MKNQRNVEERLLHARVQLLLSQPFFGSLCLRLKLEAGEVPTMATDGRLVLYNPRFALELSPQELEGVLAHEVMHCALGHHCRRGQREPRLWNRAADLAINPLLIANGFRLPAGALIEAAFSGMSAEEIYAELKRKEAGQAASSGSESSGSQSGNNNDGKDSGHDRVAAGSSPTSDAGNKTTTGQTNAADGQGSFGEVIDAADESGQRASEASQVEQQREWSVAAEQALRTSVSCGKRPAGIERPLQEARTTKQDWRAILRDFISARAPSDYRWSPPSRRYVAAGLYLPSVARTGLGAVVVAVDTSGSIRPPELEQFAGELSAIAQEAEPERLHVVYCDSAVQSAQEFAAGETIKLEPKGGGGTNFRPVFAWVAEQGIEPACLIYLTDLCCRSYPEIPHYPVLWVTASRRSAPFGETVRIGME